MLGRTLSLLKSKVARSAPFLHAKHGPQNYYKGNRCRRLGRHTRKGGYVVDHANKVPDFRIPQIPEDFPLKPYVAVGS
ncbi:hypothetical protein, conserved [Cyanidioschyzon merolae strain 10D]|jgi:large subunit ribosomal protein L41|uniref:Mitochondrial ribosomal protein L41 n=1 Tax=Cyanidioschyzon merolae (strain NIES-3377 / 10D) TaxID=280699 RepID=M1V6B5_CYAM1|nr:hypothetical protein, conserved [Cyanidioschyzon merolae strain 10D]BAM82045.1 hypothetical protein, conserved [Cyanidioschyzon merolae strain 10D]|eukprot:XP_005538081.1 hypothetical protein, conserved [Cyanidioschyzon merolae strain 10D]